LHQRYDCPAQATIRVFPESALAKPRSAAGMRKPQSPAARVVVAGGSDLDHDLVAAA